MWSPMTYSPPNNSERVIFSMRAISLAALACMELLPWMENVFIRVIEDVRSAACANSTIFSQSAFFLLRFLQICPEANVSPISHATLG